jgi:hypothetical protein
MIKKIHIKIHNTEMKINLNENNSVYCFIGENGIGKTLLLESLCKSIIMLHKLFDKKEQLYKNILQKANVVEKLKEANILLPNKLELNDTKIVDNNLFTKVDIVELERSEIKLHAGSIFKEPFAYISSKDRGYGLNMDPNNVKLLDDPYSAFGESLHRTMDKLSGKSLNQRNVADWFITRIISRNGIIIGGMQAFNDLIFLCNIMQVLEPKTFKELVSRQLDGKLLTKVYLQDGHLMFNGNPFDKLPTGYMAIIKILQDIIDTYFVWDMNKYSKNKFNKKAYFFIDELEAHLHPRWESTFIPILKKFFPKAIFFIATHSPIIVSSTDDNEAYELYKDDNGIVKNKELGNPKNWYIEDLLYQAFHIDNYFEGKNKESDKIQEIFNNFASLVKKYLSNKTPELKGEIDSIYNHLKDSLSDNDPKRITLEKLYKLTQ